MLKQPNNFSSNIKLTARLIRRSYRRFKQSVRLGSGSLHNSPILFANSFPKSGTHLLTQIMQGFSAIGPAVDSGLPAIVTFIGESGKPRNEKEIVTDLERLLPGDIAYGHVHALPGTVKFLTQNNVATFFIVRDPRDVVVSHVHYITDMAEQHVHHEFFNQKLSDFEARLRASIAGVSATDLQNAGINEISGKELPDIYSRFKPYIPWLNFSEVLLIRYEDLLLDRKAQLLTILNHAIQHGFKPMVSEEKAVSTLEEQINPQKSPTFRSGKIGGWESAFSNQTKLLFKKTSGDLLQRLGYEKTNEW